MTAPRDPADSRSRGAARIALLPVRGLWFVLWAPPRLALWAYDRFAIPARIKRIFFSEDGNTGLFPMASYKTGFGFSGGLRFIKRDFFAPKTRLRLDASYGGDVLQAYTAKFQSGRLLGRTAQFEIAGGFETFPRNRFFGIGNGDLVDDDDDPGLRGIDALADPTAVDTRFYYDQVNAEVAVALALGGPFGARIATGYQARDFDPDLEKGLGDDDLHAFTVYDPASLLGSLELSSVFVDAEVAFDTLDQPRFYLSKATPATGWYFAARGGYVVGTGDDPSEFARWGFDLRRYLDLYHGDRILILRALWHGVTAESLSRVPFVDLPKLGGGVLLRGYAQDRFRDRQAGMVSAEYQWSIDRNVSAFVFGDAGRVWRNAADFETGDLRVGFGGGLQVHSMKNYLGRILISSSIDRDLFVLLSFDPLFDTRRVPK